MDKRAIFGKLRSDGLSWTVDSFLFGFLSMVCAAPFMPGPFRLFNDAQSAVEYAEKIYAANTGFLRDAFSRFVKGDVPEKKIEAFYPYVALRMERLGQIDTRLSYGFIAEPGRYTTTLTRFDLFKDYYLEQLGHLVANHKIALEIGASSTPIPIHFAFLGGAHIEGDLAAEKAALLHDIFSLPDLRRVDDSVANGLGRFETEDKPLALFSAPRIDYSLARLRHYTGTKPEDFQNFVLFTNYKFYVDAFVKQSRDILASGGAQGGVTYTRLVEPLSMKDSMGNASLPQMPAYHLVAPGGEGVTLVNIGVGPSNARTITDHVAVLRPHAWLMLGHCAGLRHTQRLGDYVLAHAYVRDDHVLDDDLPTWVPLPALAEVQRALEAAVAQTTGLDGYALKSVMRTGTIVSTDNRNWELSGFSRLVGMFNRSRAIALDMESAVVAANGYRLRVPYGTLLCVSDRPLHGEIKLPGMANTFYQRQVSQHLSIGLKALDLLRKNGLETLHSRKLRSYDDVAFR